MIRRYNLIRSELGCDIYFNFVAFIPEYQNLIITLRIIKFQNGKGSDIIFSVIFVVQYLIYPSIPIKVILVMAVFNYNSVALQSPFHNEYESKQSGKGVERNPI